MFTRLCDVYASVAEQTLLKRLSKATSSRDDRTSSKLSSRDACKSGLSSPNLGYETSTLDENPVWIKKDTPVESLKRLTNLKTSIFPHKFCISSILGDTVVRFGDSQLQDLHSKSGGIWNAVLRTLAFALASTLLVSVTACQNGAKLLSSKQSSLGSGTSFDDSGNGTQSRIFYINTVVRDSGDSTQLDLISSNDKFSQWCIDQGSQGSNAASSCRCQYDYTKIDGSGNTQTFSVQADTTYHEANLIRCSALDIPGDVASVAVSAVHVPTNQASNAITFSMSFNGLSGDYNSPENYITVLRHQCQENLPIGFFLSQNGNSPTDFTGWDWNGTGAIQDPFISRRPEFARNTNYYETNLGIAMNKFVANDKTFVSPALPSASRDGGGGIRGYFCSFLDQETFLQSDGGGTGYDQTTQLDFRIFRRADKAQNGPMQKMFPLDSKLVQFNEMSFKLARQPTGYFSEPVVAIVAPEIQTLPSPIPSPSGSPLPIGYAIKPSRALGGEVCPDGINDVKLPPNHRFVKLWLGHAVLRPRTLQVSKKLTLDVSRVVCNPGRFIGSNHLPPSVPENQSIFKNCGLNGSYACNRSLEDGQLGNCGNGPKEWILPPDSSHPNDWPKLTDRVYLPNTSADQREVSACFAMTPTAPMTFDDTNFMTSTCGGNTAGCAGRPDQFGPGAKLLADDIYPSGTDYVLGDPFFLNQTIGHPNAGGVCGGTWQNQAPDELNACGAHHFHSGHTRNQAQDDMGTIADHSDFRSFAIDTEKNSSDDYLFFVTPTSVTWQQLTNEGSAEAAKYLPSRVRVAGTCQHDGTETDYPIPDADCKDIYNQIDYQPVGYQIGKDPGGGGDTTLDFPLCVVQDKSEGADK